jgi:aspartyl-tRNA(Asn)/glutamyl-tRNA(Gln) amidotransferase subunit A
MTSATECLARIKTLQPEINAFITVMDDAGTLSGHGPLHGMPIAVKDFYDTAGIRTTAAFTHFRNRIPQQDAVSVARLKQAGAILIGKTNMHTLGMGTTGLESAFGPVRNPRNPEYIPGGSSSGSAAAVASGMCCATLDTDAIGSCRLPAACCGVVGFKGTYGLISLEGILAGEQPPAQEILWLSHAGIMARSVQDVALMFNVLAERGTEKTQPGERAEFPRVGFARNCPPPRGHSDVYDKALEVLRHLGHQVADAAAPLVNPNTGIANIAADRNSISSVAFSDIDVLVLPTLPCAVPTIASCRQNPLALSPSYTAFANYYGLPAITVPCGIDKNGLPLGLQFIGRAHEDAVILRIARAYEMSAARI